MFFKKKPAEISDDQLSKYIEANQLEDGRWEILFKVGNGSIQVGEEHPTTRVGANARIIVLKTLLRRFLADMQRT